ncbi:tetratricopeptide repeat protein [Sphingomonas azotifigens]|uniref:tetratricopeptide repeat protein n=1 Tax=Sphingomonas azotifigens TaxID=330920 RepID=UPI000A032863|nr:tetratricopeptide repeat protein [Sphingomonas azotifigens]
MKFVSKLALTAMLALGSTALVTTPALAQKDKKGASKEDPNALKVGDAFRKAAQPAMEAVQAKNWAAATPALDALDQVVQNDDEKYYAAYLRSRAQIGQNDLAGLTKTLPILIASPRTPANELPIYKRQYYTILGNQALNDKKYPEAIDALTKAREAGNNDFDIAISLANAYAQTNRPNESVAEVDRAIQAVKATGQKPPVAWYRFAIPRVYATGNRAATADWLKKMIAEYPTKENWRWGVLVMRGSADATGGRLTSAQRIDLYRLLRTSKVLADQNDYIDYAESVNAAGLPWEAVAVIDEGRAAGKIPAGNPDVARIYTSAQTKAKAEGSLTPLIKQSQAAANGKMASQTGDAFLASGDYAKAVELYDVALQKGGVSTDEVNLHRAIALYNLGRKDDARTGFGQVKGAPTVDLAALWTVALDLPALS